MKKTAFGVVMLLIAAQPLAHAHYLWLETGPDTVRVYYGEYEEGKREQSGGRLDEVTAVQIIDPEKAPDGALFPWKKSQVSFDVPSSAFKGTGIIQVRELDRPVQDWVKYGIGIVKPLYYASALRNPETVTDAAAIAPPENKTTLGVYPSKLGASPVVRVFFKDQPLANAKVLVHAPNQWTKEWRTGEDGSAEIAFPWPGLYVIEVIHLEKESGVFQDVPYEALRHRATFAYERP